MDVQGREEGGFVLFALLFLGTTPFLSCREKVSGISKHSHPACWEWYITQAELGWEPGEAGTVGVQGCPVKIRAHCRCRMARLCADQ